MENIIEVKNFSKYFWEKQVIKDISFSIKKWENICLFMNKLKLKNYNNS